MENFSNRYVSCKSLRDILFKTYGEDWLTFTPMSLWMDIKSDFNVNPSDHVKEKILALQTYLTTDFFFTSPVGFEKMILAFNGKINNMRILEMATPFEIAFGMKEAYTVKPYEPDDFDDDVTSYVVSSAKVSGFVVYPSEFKFMEPKYPSQSLEAKIKELYDRGEVFSGQWDPVKRQKDLIEGVRIFIEEREKRGKSKNVNN